MKIRTIIPFLIHKRSLLSVVFVKKETIGLTEVYSIEIAILLSINDAVG